jgi:hypothetical protein
MTERNTAQEIYEQALLEHKTLIEGVKSYAREHYEEGWDIVIECWRDGEISREVGNSTTVEGAIKRLRPLIEGYDREA